MSSFIQDLSNPQKELPTSKFNISFNNGRKIYIRWIDLLETHSPKYISSPFAEIEIYKSDNSLVKLQNCINRIKVTPEKIGAIIQVIAILEEDKEKDLEEIIESIIEGKNMNVDFKSKKIFDKFSIGVFSAVIILIIFIYTIVLF